MIKIGDAPHPLTHPVLISYDYDLGWIVEDVNPDCGEYEIAWSSDLFDKLNNLTENEREIIYGPVAPIEAWDEARRLASERKVRIQMYPRPSCINVN